MRQLTIRGFEVELEEQIRSTARSLGTSLNKAALHLLRKGAGLEPQTVPKGIGNRLDHLIGCWTADDEADFRESIRGLDTVDPEMWT